MREKGRLVFSNLPQERITPAYAGKSRFEFFNKFIIWDHPRLCGEKKNISLEMIVILGSPPPMRGKGTSGMGRPRQAQDHPRLCGEKSDRSATCFFKSGSPPPMRGKGFRCKPLCHLYRITPAYAGKSKEHDLPFEGDEGSPPPMRGKASAPVPPSLTRGITPAYAGKRWFSVPVSAAGGDHPRLCGEKFCPCLLQCVGQGSPPPMRGKVTLLW